VSVRPGSFGALVPWYEEVLVKSWWRAWKGNNAPARPYEDAEWVERRREFLMRLSNLDMASDEVVAEEHRHIQALWLLDHVGVLEEAGEITHEQSAEISKAIRCH
jgi:hypothetical protein